jgi:hypothetical protein
LEVEGGKEVDPGLGHADVGVQVHHAAVDAVRAQAHDADAVVGVLQVVPQAPGKLGCKCAEIEAGSKANTPR